MNFCWKRGYNKPIDKWLIKVDAICFRPTEIETLFGDSTKAKKNFDRNPIKVDFNSLVKIMMKHDFVVKRYLSMQ